MAWSTGIINSQDNDAAWNNQTIRYVIDSSDWLVSGTWTKLRVTFDNSGGDNSFDLSSMRVGKQAAAGDNYDFSTTPTALNFSSNDYVTVDVDTPIVSDEISLSFASTDGIVIAVHVSSSEDIPEPTSSWISTYWKSGNDTTTVDASSYNTHSGEAPALIKVEVFSAITETAIIGTQGRSGTTEIFSLSQSISGTQGRSGTTEIYREKSGSLSGTQGRSGTTVIQATYGRELSGTQGRSGTTEIVNYTDFLELYEGKTNIRYHFILTGGADGETDITIPAANFYAIHMKTGNDTLQVGIPGVGQITNIENRQNGVMQLWQDHYFQGTLVYSDILIACDLNDITSYPGVSKNSIQLNGLTPANREDSGVVHYVTKTTFTPSTNGSKSYRLPYIDLYMRPGDTFDYDSDQFIINKISQHHTLSEDGRITQSATVSE